MNAAMARMYWGTWITDCPAGCGNAEKLQHAQRSFLCDVNVGGCGAHADVSWPQDISIIEAILSRRPLPRNQNWFPGESTDQLMQENIDHGIL